MGNLVWDGFVGARDQVMLRHCMSAMFRVLWRPWLVLLQRYCTKDAKIMAAKVGPLTARSPYQPPTKPVKLDSGAAGHGIPTSHNMFKDDGKYLGAIRLCILAVFLE